MKNVARVALAAAVLLAAPLSGAGTALDAWPDAARDGPILVRLSDGRTIEALGPVRGDDQTLILRTADRTVLSVSTATVERITAAPAREEAATPTPAAPRVYGNADLPPPLETGPAPQPPTPAPADAVAAGPEQPGAAPSYAGYRDRNGRDEAWWRERASSLAAELGKTEEDIERLEDELRVAKARAAGALPRKPNSRPISSLETHKLMTLEQARDQLEAARGRREALQAEIDGLPEEARQAGALPGWLR